MSTNHKIILRRYENYNSTKIVGFEVIINNKQSKYFEEIISLDECSNKDINEICHVAYAKLKKQIKKFISLESSKEYIPLGGEFIPPIDEDPPAEDPPAEDPPAEDPPAEDPPVQDPPVQDPPV